MKAILAVVAVLLAVTHLGDTHGDHTHPSPPHRELLVVVCVFVSSLLLSLQATSREARFRRRRRFGESALTPVFNESISNVSYVDDRELGC